MIGVSRSAVLVSVVLSWLAGGCVSLRPPAQTSPPVVSPEGVQVALLGQSCVQLKGRQWPEADLVEVRVAVGVQNPTPSPLVVHRDRFRLIAPDGTALRPVTWRASEPVTVAPGQQPSFELRYMTRGGLECAQPMELAPATGVMAGDRPLTLAAVRFLPRKPL
jgi:hypothetical protein